MTYIKDHYKDPNENIDLFNQLFYRDLKEMTPYKSLFKNSSFTDTTTSPDDHLLEIIYEVNNHGYRSKHFDGKAKLMTLGCSHSFGSGMLDEFTWSSVLAKKLNFDFARLAIPGDSAQGQVTKAFQYFKEIGHPEIIVGTFPLYRMEMPYLEGKLESKRLKKQNSELKMQQVFFDSVNFPKYAKSPFDPNEIIPKELGIFYTFLFISFLEQYCHSNNILFLWNIYEDNNRSIYNFVKDHPSYNHVLKNYVTKKINDENVFAGIPEFKQECHQEYANHILFQHAADLTKNLSAHWGIHRHIHIAEAFYEEIKKRIEC